MLDLNPQVESVFVGSKITKFLANQDSNLERLAKWMEVYSRQVRNQCTEKIPAQLHFESPIVEQKEMKQCINN